MSYYDEGRDMEIAALVGLTLAEVRINADKDRIEFVAEGGREFLMYHQNDCCESVSVDDICGDLADLIGSPVTLAEESGNSGGDGDLSDWPEGVEKPDYVESYTWTFYRIGTAKGMVTIRWYGTSNGYYSERVSFVETRA